MANPFQKTVRSLASDGPGTGALLLVVCGAGFLALSAWGIVARVPIYKASSLGRFEAYQAVHRVELPVAGRVLRSHLSLGGEVKEGDLLLELDAEAKRFQLERDESSLTALSAQLTLLREEIGGERKEFEATAVAERAALAEGNAKLEELAPQQELADLRQERAKESPQGAVSAIDLLQRHVEAEGLRRSAQTQTISIERLQRDQVAKQRGRENRLRESRVEEARLAGELAGLEATVAQLKYEVDLARVRAPSSGRLCDVVELTSGAFLNAGDRVASIVAPGTLRVRAKFTTDLVGAIRLDQRAQVKLPSYPWPLYGTVGATITKIGTESDTGQLSGGVVRVELAVEPPLDARIELQHGMQAEVEVEVGRVSPLNLLLRALGEWRTGNTDSPPPPTAQGPELANAARGTP